MRIKIKEQLNITSKKQFQKSNEYFKIIEIKNNQFKTLFHGLNGSRKLPIEKWIMADLKTVNDGGTSYLSGWHVIPNLIDCQKYLKKFKNKRVLKIVQCKAENVWKKEHSPNNVYLAEKIFIERMVEFEK